MTNMMDKFRGKPTVNALTKKSAMSVYSVGPIAQPLARAAQPDNGLPRAAMVYGAAAAIFAVLTVFMLFKGQWFTGIVMIVPTCCLGGFAYFNMKA
jgi:hypothetical protein